MKNKFPNASILTLVTQTDDNYEKLLFVYLKVIPDYYPSDSIYWYEGAGKDGKPNRVWDNLSIKQWTVCGKDQMLAKLFDSILKTRSIEIDGKKLKLSIPPFKLTLDSANPMRSRSETRFDALTSENNALIPQQFYQKENLQFLSGYRTGSSEIMPFYPLGLFEEGFIYKHLKKGIWGVKELRSAYLTFRGVRKTSVKGIGSKEIVGFYQQNFNPNSEYVAVVKNEEENEIGKGSIDQETGLFKIVLSEPTKEGKVEVLIDSKEEKAIEYVLLQDIHINSHIADKTYKDAYGRSFMITSDKKKRPESVSNFTWQQDVYEGKKLASQELSDRFKEIFDYLGPRILVADPYFINNINRDKTTQALSLSHCQSAFINALIHSAIEKGIDQFNVLGCSRVKNQLELDETGNSTKIELMFENYERILKGVVSTNKLGKFLPPSSIVFRKAKEDFHNRYWFSLSEKDGIEILDKCIVVTNSIGNMNEVDILPVSDENQKIQIARKYTAIFKNSEKRLTI